MKKYFLRAVLVCLIACKLTLPSLALNAGNFVWIIEPELEYDRISYCGACNLFGDEPLSNIDTSGFEHDPDLSNIKTNLEKFAIDGSAHVGVGHGGNMYYYFYDEKKEIFVIYWSGDGGAGVEYYTPDDFVNFFPVERLIPIREIDSETIKLDEYEMPALDYEYIGEKYALMYGGKFITGYDFDDYESNGSRYMPNDLIDMKRNDKWGLINKSGNVVIPYVFEDVEFINDDAAFVKYDGKYGVLDLRNTILALGTAPATGDNGSIYAVILLLTSVSLIFALRFRKSLKK